MSVTPSPHAAIGQNRSEVISCVCISDSDTRLKWTLTAAEHIVEALSDRSGHPLAGAITVASLADGVVPTERQLDDHLVTAPHLVVDDGELPALIADGVDLVVVNTVGSRLVRCFGHVRDVSARSPRRPIVVTGYAGLVYEKHVEGIGWRLGADVICCNSAHDRDLFRSVARSLGAEEDPIVRSGSAIVRAARLASPREQPWPPTRVVFAVQPDVPRRREDRIYLLERLVSYARAHPRRSVVVKLRSQPDERTTHRERHHYEALFRDHIVDRPTNLGFEYGHMGNLLRSTDLLLTVSSTAALEAAAMGVPVGVLTDIGVGESLGNHFFLGSGLLVSMNDVDADRRPWLDPLWADLHGLGDEDDFGEAVDRIAMLLELRRRGELPDLPGSFVTPERSPRQFAIVAAAGETRDSDAGGPPPRGRLRGLVWRVLRGPARRIHRRLERWADA